MSFLSTRNQKYLLFSTCCTTKEKRMKLTEILDESNQVLNDFGRW